MHNFHHYDLQQVHITKAVYNLSFTVMLKQIFDHLLNKNPNWVVAGLGLMSNITENFYLATLHYNDSISIPSFI